MLQELKNDLTITFSGHNIKDYLILAIESFLYFYPDFKNNVLVFDDNSNDGTREWLDENNIKWITWNRYKKMYEDEDNLAINTYTNGHIDTCLKCVLIVNELMEEANTKYIFVNDGDVCFLKDGILENYYNLIQEHKIIAPACAYPNILFSKPENEIHESLKKYKILYNKDWPSTYKFVRISPHHMFFDLEYFKSLGIKFDDLTNPEYYRYYGTYFDNGHDFYYNILVNNIPHLLLPYDLDYFLHFSWISSCVNNVENSNDKYTINFSIKNTIGQLFKQERFNNVMQLEHTSNIIKKYNLDLNFLFKYIDKDTYDSIDMDNYYKNYFEEEAKRIKND
jgi:hypothetical protein